MPSTSFAPMPALLGGALIGVASLVLMAGIGRIAGICGVALNAMTTTELAGRPWRIAFLFGLPLGAALVTAFGLKDWNGVSFVSSTPMTIIAGLLVGAGATLGSGCTSGHGICGLARLSIRSIVATGIFMATAAITVFVVRHTL